MRTIEDKIYENVQAYDIYDKLIKDIIHYQFEIKEHEKFENYEICNDIQYKIMNLIAIRSVQISRITNTSSDEIYELLNKHYNELIKEIENI